MANTTEHISVRLPKWLVDQLREDAKTQQRSLAWILGYRLAQLSNREKSDERSDNRNPSQVRSVPKGSRSVAVSNGLKTKQEGSKDSRPVESQPEVRKALGCQECGALIGHQKWCKVK